MSPDDLPSRGRTVAAAALVVGLGLFWLLLVFVQYRAGTWVDGVWVFDDEAWAFDLSAYVNAAQRLIDEGSLYLRAQVDAPYVPDGEGYYHYAPPPMLVVPRLWDHYLATLVVPAACLAQRLWRPLILQPLLSWLPIGAPILILATMLLAFLVKEERPEPAESAA